MTRRARCLLVATALVALSSASARADDDASRARELFERGVALMQNEDWDAALVQLEASFRLRPTQVALFDIGLCLERLHRYGEAVDAFERLVEQFADRGTQERVELARAELASLRALFGTVQIDVRPAGAEISVDGEVIGAAPLAEPVELTGGTHTIRARLEGREPEERRIAIVVGTRSTVELELRPIAAAAPAPAPAPAPTPRPAPRPAAHAAGLPPAWFWSAAGLSAAAAVTTAVLGGLALAGDAEYRDSRVRLASDREAGRRLVLLADVGLAVSVAAAVAALLLYGNTAFGSSSIEEPSTRVSPSVPGALGFALELP